MKTIATLTCRCGRVFWDGEDPWPHLREHIETDRRIAETQRELRRLFDERMPR